MGWHWFRILARRMNWLGRHEDEDESQFSPSDACGAVAILPRLPRSFRVAGALDGRGRRPPARYETRRVLPALPASLGGVRSVEKNHPKPCRQYVAAWRRDHSRRERRASSEERYRGTTRPRGNPRRRRSPNSQWLGRRATLLRLHLPQVPPIPLSIPALNFLSYPQIPRKSPCFLLDKRGRNGFDIEDTKCITAED